MTRRRATPESRAEARERRAALTEIGPVMDAAARFLEARVRSVHETRRRLLDAGYPGPLVEQVIARLVELGYLDDDAFARAWVESRDRAHPRGAGALRRELVLKGIDAGLIAAVLAERREGSGDGQPLAAVLARAPAGAARGNPDRDDAPDRADVDTLAAARVLARRSAALLREPDPRKRRAKAYALLARNGFDPDTCRSAVRAWEGTLGRPGDTEDTE